ncbi:MAG: hypothetical protein AB3N20_17425 [Rhizobiaceae bacterium]
MTVFNEIGGEFPGSFHDDSIYAIRLISPEPDQDDWRSELILDIDHILEWIRGDDGRFRFRLVQADLCFVDVSDLKISFGYRDTSITPLPIDRIVRSQEAVVTRQNGFQDFQWEIVLNDQANGALNFRSTGFRLEETGDRIDSDQQQIPQHLRCRSSGRS